MLFSAKKSHMIHVVEINLLGSLLPNLLNLLYHTVLQRGFN